MREPSPGVVPASLSRWVEPLDVDVRVDVVVRLARRFGRRGPALPPASLDVRGVLPASFGGRPEVALEWRRQSGLEQPRPGHGARAEAPAQLVGGLGRPPLPRIDRLEEAELLALPEPGGRYPDQPDLLAPRFRPGEIGRASCRERV